MIVSLAQCIREEILSYIPILKVKFYPKNSYSNFIKVVFDRCDKYLDPIELTNTVNK